jgi:predicted ATPase/class 3 adenylate cyclase
VTEVATRAATRLPSGFLTVLFTDVEGSTRLLRATGSRYAELLAIHNKTIRAAVSEHGGVEVRTEGDSFFCVFTDAAQAVAAAFAAQRALCSYAWPTGAKVRVRMGLHSGDAEPAEGDYVGLAVHQAARVVDAGHGGQVLVSDATRVAVGDRLPAGATLERLGAYRLKDFPDPAPLYQLFHAGLPAEFPALRALPAAAHNVPEPITLFVDRHREVVELADLAVARRVVCVVGPGGVGKTRLATELVPRVVDAFSDGVWLIELATLGNADGVVAEVAAAVGVQAEAERGIDDSLADALTDKRLLLVLDNCERVLDATARLVDRLIECCPGVHVLATSREPLGLPEENRFALMPLSVPAAADVVDGEAADAVALFADRARAVTRTFDLLREREAVVEICRRLDGLPLAIELAAARAGSIPVRHIASRLDRRFSVVRQTHRGRALKHHVTLRGSIEWSHDLLETPEKVLMRRLGVFVGGFDLEAAERICGSEPLAEDEIIDLLANLVEKSLVQQTDGRFSLLESIREFAREQLQESGEIEHLQTAHLQHFTSFVEDAACQANGPRQRDAYDRLDADLANIRAAVERALASADPAALRLAAALGQYGFVRNRIGEVANWCIDAAAAVPAAPPALRGRALMQAGFALIVMGSPDRAQALLDESLTLARSAADHELLLDTLLMTADLLLEAGQPSDAQPLAREALELTASDPQEWLRARALVIAARADQHEVEYDETHRRLAHARSLFERAGDRRQVARVLLTMAYVSLAAGEIDVAEAEAVECATICEELEHPIGRAVARIVQVWAAIDHNESAVAHALLGQTIATAQDAGYRALLAYSVAARAALSAADGQLGDAARTLGALEASGSVGGEGAAAIRARLGRLRTELETRLGSEQFAALRVEGASLTLEQIAARPV